MYLREFVRAYLCLHPHMYLREFVRAYLCLHPRVYLCCADSWVPCNVRRIKPEEEKRLYPSLKKPSAHEYIFAHRVIKMYRLLWINMGREIGAKMGTRPAMAEAGGAHQYSRMLNTRTHVFCYLSCLGVHRRCSVLVQTLKSAQVESFPAGRLRGAQRCTHHVRTTSSTSVGRAAAP